MAKKTKQAPFFNPNQKEWREAVISCGTYNTRNYFSREYRTKSGLAKGLKSFGYKSTEPYSGETWNYGAKQYKVRFDYK
jgi:hypothetical protein